MAAGRRLIISQGGTPIAGVKEKSISYNGEPLDITDDQSGGWRILDPDVGKLSIDLSVSGYVVSGNNALRSAIKSGTPQLLLQDITITDEVGGTVECDFFLTSLEESGPEGDSLGFSVSMLSSGQPVFGTP